MSIQLKLRRGTTAQHSTFTGASGEVTVDTDKKTLVVHDGTTAGGNPVLPANNPSYTGTFTGGTGIVNIGSGQFYKDASGNVGIGTSSPSYAIDVQKVVTAGNLLRLKRSDVAGEFQIYQATNQIVLDSAAASGVLSFATVGSERMRIDSSGNVGIGCTPQSISRLDVLVAGSTDQNAGLQVRSTTAGTGDGTTTVTAIRAVNSSAGNWSNTKYHAYSHEWGVGGSASANASMKLDSSGQIWTTNGAGAVAKAYDCRAWVNFNGTGTVVIRGSGNVSSITDNGVGLYTVNFTTAMSDANYSMGGSALSSNTNVAAVVEPVTFSTSSAAIKTMRGATTTTVNDDADPVCAQFFR